MRYGLVAITCLSLVLAGCGGQKATVPDVAGKRLDVAKEALDDAGLEYRVSGGGAFGVVVETHWVVCAQHPRAGRRSRSVELVVARSCPGSRPRRGVPKVVGLRLDAAERELGRRGVEYYVYADDKVMIRSNWTVCEQYPEAGERANEVDLYVGHFSCDEEDWDE